MLELRERRSPGADSVERAAHGDARLIKDMGINHRCAFPLLYLLVARERSFYLLILRGGRHVLVRSQITQKRAHLLRAHCFRVTFSMEKDEAFDPVHVCLFRPQ